MAKRIGNYPNKADFEPFFGINKEVNGVRYELPLADPSESNAVEAFWKIEMIELDFEAPSAFAFNKELNL